MPTNTYSCKDIDDRIVLAMAKRRSDFNRSQPPLCPVCGRLICKERALEERSQPGYVPWLWDQLIEEFPDYPEKVLYAKIERLVERGLLEYGCSPRGAWPTPKGEALLEKLMEVV